MIKKILMLGIGILLAVQFKLIDNPFSNRALPGDAKVIMYSTAWCGYCKKTRELLTQAGVAFEELDIEQSKQAKQQYDLLNGNGVPLLVIDTEIVRGYQAEKIQQLLRI